MLSQNYHTASVADNSTGFAHYEVAGRHVPDVNAVREMSVQLTSRDKTHVKCSAAKVPQAIHMHTVLRNSQPDNTYKGWSKKQGSTTWQAKPYATS